MSSVRRAGFPCGRCNSSHASWEQLEEHRKVAHGGAAVVMRSGRGAGPAGPTASANSNWSKAAKAWRSGSGRRGSLDSGILTSFQDISAVGGDGEAVGAVVDGDGGGGVPVSDPLNMTGPLPQSSPPRGADAQRSLQREAALAALAHRRQALAAAVGGSSPPKPQLRRRHSLSEAPSPAPEPPSSVDLISDGARQEVLSQWPDNSSPRLHLDAHPDDMEWLTKLPEHLGGGAPPTGQALPDNILSPRGSVNLALVGVEEKADNATLLAKIRELTILNFRLQQQLEVQRNSFQQFLAKQHQQVKDKFSELMHRVNATEQLTQQYELKLARKDRECERKLIMKEAEHKEKMEAKEKQFMERLRDIEDNLRSAEAQFQQMGLRSAPDG